MPIRVEQDDRIRAVGSVLLLTHLIKMNDYWKYPAAKALTLEHVLPYRDHPCAKAARDMDPPSSMGSAFHCFAVWLEWDQGRFSVPATEQAEFGDRFLRCDFAGFLTDFYHDAGLDGFWKATSNLWEEAVSDCRAMLAEEDPGAFLDLLYGDIVSCGYRAI